MKPDETIQELAKQLGIAVRANNYSFNIQLLADKINELIANDFQQLITVLYRMDVSEPKLKLLLKENPDSDAGMIIAELMIERQAQKIISRKETKKNSDIPEDEKW